MTNYGTDNLVTHILALIWSKNSNSQMYKVTFPKIRHFPEMVNFGRSFIDTIMGISRGDWKCPEDYRYSFWCIPAQKRPPCPLEGHEYPTRSRVNIATGVVYPLRPPLVWRSKCMGIVYSSGSTFRKLLRRKMGVHFFIFFSILSSTL